MAKLSPLTTSSGRKGRYSSNPGPNQWGNFSRVSKSEWFIGCISSCPEFMVQLLKDWGRVFLAPVTNRVLFRYLYQGAKFMTSFWSQRPCHVWYTSSYLNPEFEKYRARPLIRWWSALCSWCCWHGLRYRCCCSDPRSPSGCKLLVSMIHIHICEQLRFVTHSDFILDRIQMSPKAQRY